MKREELIRSKGYNVTKIQNELFRELTEYLEKNLMNQTQFADKLGVTKGYVSQILNGDFDYKLSKLVELSLAIGKVPKIQFVPIEELERQNESLAKIVELKPKYFTNKRIGNNIQKVHYEEVGLKEFKLAN